MKSIVKDNQAVIDEVNLMMSLYCGIGQKKMKFVRHQLFSQFVPIFHFNPISSLHRLVDLRHEKTRDLLEKVLGFHTVVKKDKVAIVGNVKQILNYLLNQKGASEVYVYPKNEVHVLLYTDAYPFFRFSQNCNSQTSIQLKPLTAFGFCDVFPICRWFGDDDPESTNLFAPLVLQQFQNLEIVQDGVKKEVTKSLISDGKNRRGLTSIFAPRPKTERKRKKERKKGLDPT